MSAYRCEDFRARLAEADSLSDRPSSLSSGSLDWHRHLVECASCRDHLASEEHLDDLLATVPEPHVPADLARRVQAALAPMRGAPRPLHSHEDQLDALLDALPEPLVPEGLSQRVLAGLDAERAPAPFTRLRGRGLLVAAAAILLIVFTVGRLRGGSTEPEVQELAYFREELQDEEELVVYALENWELLMSDEIEVYLASLDPEEQALFELDLLDADEEAAEEAR